MTKPQKKKILIAIALILWFQIILILGVVKVSGNSMNNTLEDDNSYYTKDIKTNKIKRFDIVIIDSPKEEVNIVKRVVGLPGETIKYTGGNLYINQNLVEQNFDYIEDGSEFEQVLGDDEYFVLGDNRGDSLDSRIIGPIKYDEIKSIVMYK